MNHSLIPLFSIPLFKSKLEHTVPSINTLKDRYGIAFNCFPKGNIGYGSEHLLL